MPRTVLISLLVAALVAGEAPDLLPEAAPASGSFMLVELFTSEGCSSCPPADELVNRLHADARRKGQPLIALSWHVDYWNRLKTKHGVWADPYSSAEATERQRRYSTTLPKPGYKPGMLVTPQLLIDGQHLGVAKGGSMSDFIASRYAVLRPARVGLDAVALAQGRLTWSVTGAAAGSELLLAVVQRDIVQQVTAGENHGKQLRHQNAVRSFQTLPLQEGDSSGEAQVALPAGVPIASAGLVAVVQGSKDLAVQAAGACDWPAAP